MNTNPHATTILCYGDSNTHGSHPDKPGRYDAATRWPGRVQQILGDDFYVIEEGLGGRTVNLDHFDDGKPGRNGWPYFQSCLESHLPLDWLIIMLGTNDLKVPYSRSVEQIAEGLKEYVEYARRKAETKTGKTPQILLVSPMPAYEAATELWPELYDDTAREKSRQLAGAITAAAEATGCLFLDAAPLTKPGPDGLHLTAESHAQLAVAIAEQIRSF